MTNQRLSELRYKGYITDAEYNDIKSALYAIDAIKQEIKAIQKEDMECDGCSDMGMVLDIIDKHTKGESE